MTETIKTNFALRPETIEAIEKLAKLTNRGKSNVVDWLVANAMDQVEQAHRDSVTVEQALEKTSELSPSS